MSKNLCLPLLLAGILCPATAAFAQTPNITGVVNIDTYPTAWFCPGIVAMITGTNLGPTTRVNLPIFPADLSVKVGTTNAAILSMGVSSVTIQVPVELPAGTFPLVLTYQGRTSNTVNITLSTYAHTILASTAWGDLASRWTTWCQTTVDDAHRAIPGQSLSLYAFGLGATNPVVPTGVAAPTSSLAETVVTPVVKIGGKAARVQRAYLEPGEYGFYIVEFTVPQNTGLSSGNQSLWLEMGGTMSNIISLPFDANPAPVINNVYNAGSHLPPTTASPATIVGIVGANFGAADSRPNGLFPATSFQDTSVLINGSAVPMFGVFGPLGGIAALVPSELSESGTAAVQVKVGSQIGPACTLNLRSWLPGVFRLFDPKDPTRNFAAAVQPGTLWLPLPQSMATTFGIPYGSCGNKSVAADAYRFCAQPVTVGDSLEVYLTGLGKATLNGNPNGQLLPTGTLAPLSGPLYWAVHKPTVYIGGVKLADNYLTYWGLTPGTAGVCQLDLQVPPGVPTGDAVLLQVVMPDSFSDQVPIAVR